MLHDPLHHLRHILNKELTEIYLATAIRQLALAMFGIFVPIYLLIELSYKLTDVGYFYIVHFLIASLMMLFSSKLSSKIGIKHNILISSFIMIFSLLTLHLLKSNPIWFFPSAIIWGISSGMFWFSLHADMVKSTKTKYSGQQISLIFVLATIGSILGPFFAGLILEFSTFTILFLVVSFLLIVSTFPLFQTKDVKPRTKISLKRFIKEIKNNHAKNYFSEGLLDLSFRILWPIFIYSIVVDYLKLGTVQSILGIVAPIILVIAGRMVDHSKVKEMLKIGAIFTAISVLLRILVTDIYSLIAVGILGAISWSFLVVSIHKDLYRRAKGKEGITEILARESFLAIGRVSILLILILTNSLIISFLVAGVLSIAAQFF